MYINTITKKYPYSKYDLVRDNPSVSFPKEITDDLLASYNIMPVLESSLPSLNTGIQVLVETSPVFTDGKWYRQWNIENLSEDEISQKQSAIIESFKQQVVNSAQEKLDAFAKTRNYDSILSACTYATSSVAKFAKEGQYAVSARDATWAALYQILEEVQAGQREAPTGFSDIEHLLPPLEWPV